MTTLLASAVTRRARRLLPGDFPFATDSGVPSHSVGIQVHQDGCRVRVTAYFPNEPAILAERRLCQLREVLENIGYAVARDGADLLVSGVPSPPPSPTKGRRAARTMLRGLRQATLAAGTDLTVPLAMYQGALALYCTAYGVTEDEARREVTEQ